MAHITEFEVVGLVGRHGTYGERLNRDVNVFFGVNGSGKTSLLKILHAAMANETRILANLPFQSARVVVYSEKYQSEFTSTYEKPTKDQFIDEGVIVSSGMSAANVVRLQHYATPEGAWSVSPKPKDGATKWQHRYLPTSRLYAGADVSLLRAYEPRDITASEDELEVVLADLLDRLWATYSATILGSAKRAQEGGLNRILRSVLSKKPETVGQDLNPDEAYARAATFLGGASGRVLGTKDEFRQRFTDDARMQNVIAQITIIQDQVAQLTVPRTRLQQLITDMFSGTKALTFTDNSIEIQAQDKAKIRLASLSSGEKQLLRILLETLTAESNTIIVDEPEISMHVDWQRRLIAAMQLLNPRCQIISATHSPEVMADVDDEKIFRL